MYFSKDADAVPPPLNHPGSTGAGPRQKMTGEFMEKFAREKISGEKEAE